jgi:hypothetical protein
VGVAYLSLFHRENDCGFLNRIMNFYLYSDADPAHGIIFPTRLSQFYEQYRGFGEQSEYAQVSELLDINLTSFQKYNEPDEEVIWQDVDVLLQVNRELRDKIVANPDLYSRMTYGGITDIALKAELLRAAIANDKKKMDQIIRKFKDTPDSAYPPDVEFIKRYFFSEVIELDKILHEIKAKGAKKINIVYA